jgi:hypothetical protein
MNIFGRLIRKLPATVLALLALGAFVVGSHAAMDYLVHENMGECISVGASAEFCLVPVPPLTLD